MLFKALVKNKDTGEVTTIESDYSSKSDFINDLKHNGYSVHRAEPKELYDFVVDNSNGNKWDWETAKKLYKENKPLTKEEFEKMKDGEEKLDYEVANDFAIDAIKDNFTPPGAKNEESEKDAPSFDAYMDARRHIDKLRDTYKKQKEEYDIAQRMKWAENAKKEGSILNPMYGLKPNDFENSSDYKKYVDTITSFEKANNYPSWLEENPFETMYSKKDEIDTNDNGKIEEDEMADFQKSLDDYAAKNKKGRDDIPVTTRR